MDDEPIENEQVCLLNVWWQETISAIVLTLM